MGCFGWGPKSLGEKVYVLFPSPIYVIYDVVPLNMTCRGGRGKLNTNERCTAIERSLGAAFSCSVNFQEREGKRVRQRESPGSIHHGMRSSSPKKC